LKAGTNELNCLDWSGKDGLLGHNSNPQSIVS
jgi:hypothetical protein